MPAQPDAHGPVLHPDDDRRVHQPSVGDEPAGVDERARREAPLARCKAVTGIPHSRTTTVLLGEPVNAMRQASTAGSTVSKHVWTLEQLVGVHSRKPRQPVERGKVRFGAEDGDDVGRGAEVLVDPSDECPRIKLVFDRTLDTPDARDSGRLRAQGRGRQVRLRPRASSRARCPTDW